MKLKLNRDQHENRIVRCEVPLIGYLIIRREGRRPHLSVEKPLYGYLRTTFRVATIFSALIFVFEGVVLALGITEYAVVIFVVGALTEVIDIVDLGEHQVVRASTAVLTLTANEASVDRHG